MSVGEILLFSMISIGVWVVHEQQRVRIAENDAQRKRIQMDLFETQLAKAQELSKENLEEELRKSVLRSRVSRAEVNRMMAARRMERIPIARVASPLKKTVAVNESGEMGYEPPEVHEASMRAAWKIDRGIYEGKGIIEMLVHLDDDELKHFEWDAHPMLIDSYVQKTRYYMQSLMNGEKKKVKPTSL